MLDKSEKVSIFESQDRTHHAYFNYGQFILSKLSLIVAICRRFFSPKVTRSSIVL